MASDSRNVELSKFDERWVVFLMKEYVRRLHHDLGSLSSNGLSDEAYREMRTQGQWMVDYATQRNQETCENLGIDPVQLRE